MKKIFLLFVFLTATTTLFAQNPWTAQTSNVTATLTSVCTAPGSPNIAWVCGYTGTVLRTTNYGTNWTNLTGHGIPTTVSLINIAGTNTKAITAGYSGSDTWVWLTTNSGQNWVQVFSQPGGFINAIWMSSETNGFMMGDPVGARWSLWRTTNGGLNWDSSGLYLPQVGTEAGWNNGLWMYQSRIWFGTNNSKIYYSSNNGANWIAQSTSPEVNSYAVCMDNVSGMNGFAGGATLLYTSNGGTNWASITSLGSGNFGGLAATNLPVSAPMFMWPTWYVRSSNVIYASTNGSSWFAEYTNPSAMSYRHLSVAAPGRGIWAVGTLGTITFHQIIAGVEPIGQGIPDEFYLAQNYPNPFNSMTNVKFQMSNKGFATIKVFDVVGREIATIVNEVLDAGVYEIKFDGENLESGIYFYRLVVNGEVLGVRKMLLVK